MMKTKLTLFVTVLAAALFVGGCASLETLSPNDLVDKDGLWHHKDSGKPATGRVIVCKDGGVWKDYHLKDGKKHGPYTKFWLDQNNGKLMHGAILSKQIYTDGVLTNSRGWHWNEKQYEYNLWNPDGTPKAKE